MANDLWRTPPEVFEFIENKFGRICLDLCSSNENKVCTNNITEEDDFLDDKWIDHNDFYNVIGTGELAWCNPPYSNPLPFVKQCVKWAKSGYAVAGILNLDSSTKWFTELRNANALFMPIVGGRIQFIGSDGLPSKNNNKPQFMFYLAPFLSKSVGTEYISINDIYQTNAK